MTGSRRVLSVPDVAAPQAIRFPEAAAFQAGPMQVLLAARTAMPILDLHMVLRHGAVVDPPALAGCASLTATSIDAGTASLSEDAIARRLEALGTGLTIQTTWDHCSIGVRVLADHMQPALQLLADLTRNAAFPVLEHARRKRIRLEAIAQERNEPSIVADHAIARAIFGPEHPYGRPQTGTLASIGALKRSDIVDFHRRHFQPGRAFLVAAGDAEPEALRRAVHNALGGWSNAGTDSQPEETGPPTVAPGIRLVDRPGAPQSEIRLGAVGATRDSNDYFPLLVLNAMLGGSFTSRLNMKLREERGYTYGAFSRFAFRRSRGPFVAGAAVDARATHLAVADALNVINRTAIETAAEDEVDRARRYLALGLVHGLETNADVAARMTEMEIHGLGSRYYDHYVERISAVNAEQVRDAAARYLGERLALVVVGDGTLVRKDLEKLDLGPVAEEPDQY